MTSSTGSLPQTRHLATAIPGPTSTALHRKREAHVTSGVGVTLPIFINRASGGILDDVDGNRIIFFDVQTNTATASAALAAA
jgi:4-aminobutyrate aminotransferase/(S)-3-amino-2-methylpropionate transaminase